MRMWVVAEAPVDGLDEPKTGLSACSDVVEPPSTRHRRARPGNPSLSNVDARVEPGRYGKARGKGRR